MPFLRHTSVIHWTAEGQVFITGKNYKQSARATKDAQLFIANSITYIIVCLTAIGREAIHIPIPDIGWIFIQSNIPSWKPVH